MSDDFWADSTYFTGPPLTAAMLRDFEGRFGYELPEAYLRLLRHRNGGVPRRRFFPIEGLAGWDAGYLEINHLRGVFRGGWAIDDNDMGNNYPAIGLIVGGTPSGGHDHVMLDYRTPGPTGEPRVVHANQDDGPDDVTLLAPTFEAFLEQLVARRPVTKEAQTEDESEGG